MAGSSYLPGWLGGGDPVVDHVVDLATHTLADLHLQVVGGCTFIKDYYDHLLSLADKRVESWPLMASPYPTISLVTLYFIMCEYGPKLMEGRQAFSLRPVIVVYNLFCAALNMYIGIELFVTQRNMTYKWSCEPVDYSMDENSVRIASALWWYYASKLFEMLDSLFIILRKRNNQLSFLHVYHHSTMFVLWWIGVKFVAGGSSFLGALFNCWVHVLMYTYYALAAYGGPVKKYLWWKKYLTLIQMVQFVAALVMGCNAIRIGCDFPMWMQYMLVIYMASFLLLFSDFYYKAYINQRSRADKSKAAIAVDTAGNGHADRNSNGHVEKGQSEKGCKTGAYGNGYDRNQTNGVVKK